MMRRLAAPLLCSSFFLLMACGSNNTNSKILNKIQLQNRADQCCQTNLSGRGSRTF